MSEPSGNTLVVFQQRAHPMSPWAWVWWASSRLILGSIIAFVLWSVLEVPGIAGGLIGWFLYVAAIVAAGPRLWPARPCMYCDARGPLVKPILRGSIPYRQWWLRWLPARVPVDWICQRHFLRWVEDQVSRPQDDHAHDGAVDEGRDEQ